MNVFQPKVSVFVVTYNHERFIAQALDSVLMQRVAFGFEIVIGEDCSTDRTLEIVESYEQRHPDRVRVLRAERNLGIARNWQRTVQACRGQYIAMLEGDDYWTNPQKLQKLADFLDGHPEFATCFHDALVVHENGLPDKPFPIVPKKAVYALEDIVQGNFVPTSACMFRNGLVKEFPNWYATLPSYCDWHLHALNAQYGKLGYIDEVMSVYRVHAGAAWSQGGTSTWSIATALQRHAENLNTLELLNRHFAYRFAQLVRPHIAKECFDLVWFHQCAGQWRDMRRYFWKGVRASPASPGIPWWAVLKYCGIAHLPPIYRLWKRLGRARKEASPDNP